MENEELPLKEASRDFLGNLCPYQPGENQLPTVSGNPRSRGCEIRAFSSNAEENVGGIDVLQLYKETLPSAVLFKMSGTADGTGRDPEGSIKTWGGSGVAIEKNDSSCLIITDNHVTDATPAQHVKVTDTKVVMADGKAYAGTVVARDESRDLALVKIDTDSRNDLCRPAKIAASEADGSQQWLLAIGQPYTSGSLYASLGQVIGLDRRSSINNLIAPLPGEDPGRPVIVSTIAVREGFSGGAAFDSKGQVTGLIDIATGSGSSIITPLSEKIISELKSKRTDK